MTVQRTNGPDSARQPERSAANNNQKNAGETQMNQQTNPYAPSEASLRAGDVRPTTGLMHDGKVLLLPQDCALPDRCVKCNDDAVLPIKERTVYWHHAGWYLMLLVNVILYVIVALVVRKTAKVSPGLCERHKRKRNVGLFIGWGGALLGLAGAVSAGANDSPGLALSMLLLILVAMITGIIMSRVVYASRIDDRYIRLKGCGPEFLTQWPPFRPGTRDM
jgi:hypothetical protein